MSSDHRSSNNAASTGGLKAKSKGNSNYSEPNGSDSTGLVEPIARPRKPTAKPSTSADGIDTDNSGDELARNPKAVVEKPKRSSARNAAKNPGKSAVKEPTAKKSNTQGKGKEKALDNNENSSDDEALDDPHPTGDDSDQDSDDVASAPITHSSLDITTSQDKIAYKALLPYLAKGFAIVKTESAGNPAHDCGFRALHLSYNSARKALLGSPDHEPLSLEDLRKIFKGREYRKVVSDYVKYVENERNKTKIDQRIKVLHEPGVGPLTMGHMSCLLRVVNAQYETHFQLGVIKSGFQGRYDEKIKEFDPNYIQQSRLQIVDEPLLTRPVVWIHDINEVEKIAAHLDHIEVDEGELPQGATSHWEGFTELESADGDDQNREEQTEEFGLSERVKKDVAAGLWIVKSLPVKKSKPGWSVGTSVQGMKTIVKRTPLVDGYAPNGEHTEFNTRNLTQITSDNKLKPARPRPGKSKSEKAKGNKVAKKEPQVKDEPKDSKFFRIIPPTTRKGRKSKEGDQVVTRIGNFKPAIGEIVLDTGGRKTFHNMPAAEVIRPSSTRGWVYLRCLQPLEHPFRFVDKLPLMQPWENLPEYTTIAELQKVYNAIHEKPQQVTAAKKSSTIQKLNKEEPLKRTKLSLFRLKDDATIDIQKKPSRVTVEFNKGEYVLLLGRDVLIGNTKRKKHQIMDFEGKTAYIAQAMLERETKPAWGLTFSKSAIDDGLHFEPEEITPSQEQQKPPPNTKNKNGTKKKAKAPASRPAVAKTVAGMKRKATGQSEGEATGDDNNPASKKPKKTVSTAGGKSGNVTKVGKKGNK